MEYIQQSTLQPRAAALPETAPRFLPANLRSAESKGTVAETEGIIPQSGRVTGSPQDVSMDNTSTLELLFRKHYGRALRAAYRITGNFSDAEDCAQTVFLKLARGFDAQQLEEIPASYIQRASVNAALDCLRSRKRAPATSDPVDLDEIEAPVRDPEMQRANVELAGALRKALARLGPTTAQIFALRYLENVPNHDIARMLGKSRTAVAIVLLRARTQLRRYLTSTVEQRRWGVARAEQGRGA